jgi:beta-glucosidase
VDDTFAFPNLLPRFGLYRVDFETLERTPTPSVEYFRRVATSRRLTAP